MTAVSPQTLRLQRPDGFTLLEVMVSLMVLAVVMVTLFRLHAGTIRLTEAGKTAATLPLLAQYQLSEIEAGKAEPGTLSGRFADDISGLEWTCTIEPAEFTDPVTLSDEQSKRLRKIILEITDTEGARIAVITTWRYMVEHEGN